MRYLRPSTEDEMIAEFLRAEIDSQRFGLATAEEMVRHAATLTMLRFPDLTNPQENWKRRSILAQTRGWGRNEKLFEGFPSNIAWYVGSIEEHDLQHISFSANKDWSVLSGGTLSPANVARRMNSESMEPQVMEVPEYLWALKGVEKASKAIGRGDALPPPIVVSPIDDPDIVIMEGFTRFSALMLAEKCVGATVIVGEAKRSELRHWVGTGDRKTPRRFRPRRSAERWAGIARSLTPASGDVRSSHREFSHQ
jgi:hypothetical protein